MIQLKLSDTMQEMLHSPKLLMHWSIDSGVKTQDIAEYSNSVEKRLRVSGAATANILSQITCLINSGILTWLSGVHPK
jgi:uncharacterized protein (DUF1786 family)